MQLTYRGVQYDYNPHSAKAIRETSVFRAIRPSYSLVYRGSVYTVDPNVEPALPVIHPSANLMYRGIAYTLNGGGYSPVATQNRAGVMSQPRNQKKTSAKAEFAVTHRSNLRTNAQRRLQIARERGDQNLVSLLERELQEIV